MHSLWTEPLTCLGAMLCLSTVPTVLELLVLTVASVLPKGKRSRASAPRDLGRLVVLVPCHNEELHIAECLESISNSLVGDTKIVLVAHNCTDATIERAAAFPRALIHVLNEPSRRGKGFALEEGFSWAVRELHADAILVIDADSVVSANLVAAVRTELAYSDVLQCSYTVKNADANWRTNVISLAMQAINVIRPKGRDRLALSCGIFGNGFAFRKGVLDRVPYNAYSLVEDLEYHLALVTCGYRVRFLQAATVMGEMPVSEKAARSQRARWEGGRMRMVRSLVYPIWRQLLSGKLRLAEPLLDLLCMPLASCLLVLLFVIVLPNSITRNLAAGALLIIFLHLIAAARVGANVGVSLRAVFYIPLYILWKLTMLGPIVKASRTGSEWVRTRRGVSRY